MPDQPLKIIEVQGRKYALGRLAPKTKDRTFLSGLGLLTAPIPTPPASIPIPAVCADGLSQTFMNTHLGCCVISHHAHFLANITSQIGKPFIYTDKQIEADYHAVGGYIPGNPWTDRGCDVGTDLSYLQSTGFADGSKLLGSINLDPTSQLALTQSVWITNGVCFGMAMPNAWIDPAPQESGFVWDVAGHPNDSNGHCFTGFAYTPQGITIDTWGMTGTITWAAIAKYGAASANGEVYSYINPAMINPTTGLAPQNGLTLNQICTYFNSMGGNVVVPPGPTPTPTPTPGPVSVNVPFGVYNLTISGTPNPVPNPTPATPPDPVTITWNGQVLVLSATMASKN
jgi:hypothetical protein